MLKKFVQLPQRHKMSDFMVSPFITRHFSEILISFKYLKSDILQLPSCEASIRCSNIICGIRRHNFVGVCYTFCF